MTACSEEESLSDDDNDEDNGDDSDTASAPSPNPLRTEEGKSQPCPALGITGEKSRIIKSVSIKPLEWQDKKMKAKTMVER